MPTKKPTEATDVDDVIAAPEDEAVVEAPAGTVELQHPNGDVITVPASLKDFAAERGYGEPSQPSTTPTDPA